MFDNLSLGESLNGEVTFGLYPHCKHTYAFTITCQSVGSRRQGHLYYGKYSMLACQHRSEGSTWVSHHIPAILRSTTT